MTDHFIRPDVRQLLDYLAGLDAPKSHEVGPIAARRMFTAMRGLADVPTGDLAVIRDLSFPGPGGEPIPLRLFDARAERPAGPALVYFHGGGFVLGDLDSHEPVCAEIARGLDLPVVSVDYRLSPEHPWPAAPDDCEAAARWIADAPAALGIEPTSLVLAGDSAGGVLTIVTALALRDRRAAVPVIAQWPIYPAVGIAADYPSYHAFGDGFLLTREGMDWFDQCYAPDLSHWRAMPILGDQSGLPPTLVLTASLDPLLDQGRAYAAATIAAGVPTVYREARGNIHGFMNLRKALPSSEGDLQSCLAVLKAMIAEAATHTSVRESDPVP